VEAACARPFPQECDTNPLSDGGLVNQARCLWLRAVRLTQGSFRPLGELDRVIIRPEVHVEGPRHVHEAMIVDGRNLDAVLREGSGDGVSPGPPAGAAARLSSAASRHTANGEVPSCPSRLIAQVVPSAGLPAPSPRGISVRRGSRSWRRCSSTRKTLARIAAQSEPRAGRSSAARPRRRESRPA